jgi:CHAT domain-containing protein
VAIDLGPAQPIDALVERNRHALADPATTYHADAARALSEKLIKPLTRYLRAGERLLLSPDGELNLVPFGALMDEHGDYLVQHFDLSYLTSGRDLLRMAAETPSRGSSVVLADPAFGSPPGAGAPRETGDDIARSSDLDRSGLQFARLPGTAREAKELASVLNLGSQNVLTGDRATEAALRALHGPRILHLATHAFFLSDQELPIVLKPTGTSLTDPSPLAENPLLRTGLALTGANARHSGTADDGILTGTEAAQLDLAGTQLAVLSACDTGVGQVRTGDGVYGLRRALVLAGAQAQLVSLWKVADAPTQKMMVDYYRGLVRGEGRSAALRATQLAMLKDPARRHPYYWAAFIPIGSWTPLAPEHRPP